MSQKNFRLNWKGDQVLKLSEEQASAILVEYALIAEGESKKELEKGHGVKTGTLRRSIHAASPDYNFGQDNVAPGAGTPERGGEKIKAKRVGGKLMVLLGSGLSYAMAIHQGWNWQKNGLIGVFGGYHYLTKGVEKAKDHIERIIARHQVGKK